MATTFILQTSSNIPKCTSCQRCDDTHIAIPDNTSSLCPSTIQKCEACLRVAKMTTEVEEAAEKLKQLIENLQRAKAEMNHQRSSVVKKLPAEILSTIFEFYTSDTLPPSSRLQDEIQFEVPQNNILRIPFLLSNICHRWRQVAFSTPQIWTTLTIFLDRCDGSPVEEDLISAWISRTRNHPLTIHLHSSLNEDYETEFPEDFHLPVLQVLASSSRQWRHFSARVPTYILDYLGTEAQDIPLIETVGIRLRAPDVDEDGFIMHPLWKALTTMRVEYISTEECVTLVSSTPNLVTCIFDDIRRRLDGGHTASQRVVEHPNLQHFAYESVESCDIFERLKLPGLRSLKCASRHDLIETWSTVLPDFFANSRMEKLEVLRLPNTSFTSDQLNSLLSMAPALTQFTLVCIGGHGEVITGLLEHLAETAGNTSSPGQLSPRGFLPNLTSIEFEIHDACFPWENVAPCFPHVVVSDANPKLPNTKEVVYRPLSTFKVIDSAPLPEEVYGEEWDWLIPGETLEDLIPLMQRGVEIVFEGHKGHDLFEHSMENAGMDLKNYASYLQGKGQLRSESN
ncbi:hypothetical protein CPC08DRAFT_711898 [Agrocybe pediades]|nr:hypothetical protein CPC08DRAFT_711898 [Agrocybe pediades]